MRTKTFLLTAAIAVFTTALPRDVVAQSDMVNGQVTKIDQSAAKITIRHGPMPKFELDEGHTMVFRVQNSEILKQVKVGDKIEFEADRINGQFTVVKIQKSK